MSSEACELVLVRHGETVGQSSIRLYGATDIALAPEGEAQIRAAARSLLDRRFDAVFTIQAIAGFREIDFGAWEGWTWDEVRERDPINYARWTSEGGRFRFPGGEQRDQFFARVQQAIGPSIEARFAAGARSILAVVHKGVIKAIAARMLERSLDQLADFDLPLGAVRCLRRASASAAWTGPHLAPHGDHDVA